MSEHIFPEDYDARIEEFSRFLDDLEAGAYAADDITDEHMRLDDNILPDEVLSLEDREARAKLLQLVIRIEHLYRTDEDFRRWYHEGLDQAEAGQVSAFDEDEEKRMWKRILTERPKEMSDE